MLGLQPSAAFAAYYYAFILTRERMSKAVCWLVVGVVDGMSMRSAIERLQVGCKKRIQ